ncbi:MAG: hypothetical protein ACREDQ_02485 [Limisphaerales bacterium]
MKKITRNTKITVLATGIAGLAALTLMSGPVVTVHVPAPVVTVQVPAPTITVAVPDTYVWDGYEFVGVVGDQYYYLGPGNVWIVCDRARLTRFHGWEKAHADWRAHAIVNERYRLDAHGHMQPRHPAGSIDKDHHGKDRDH